jgi:predicted ATPase
MGVDRLKWIRIEGFRSIEDLKIELGDLQVLIGENGSGKSTIIEAFELLSLLASEQRFTVALANRHGLLQELVSPEASQLRLSVRVENTDQNGDEPTAPLEYSIALASVSSSRLPAIVEERLVGQDLVSLIDRNATGTRFFDDPQPTRALSPESSALNFFGQSGPAENLRIRRMFAGFRVHTPFETRSLWSRLHKDTLTMRSMAYLEETTRLERGGSNLTSVFQQLSNEGAEKRQRVIEDIQLGLGLDVSDFLIKTRGRMVELMLRIGDLDVGSSQLSDGQLAYLGLVALRHLADREATVVVFDEPELHMHPALVVRAAWLFEQLSKRTPVIVATHSEAFIDALGDPVKTMRVLELQNRKTVMRTLAPEQLERWKDIYTSVGQARREGRLEDLLAS